MGCSTCGKKTTISGGRSKMSSAPATPTKRRIGNSIGSPYGSPKVRMSFNKRNG